MTARKLAPFHAPRGLRHDGAAAYVGVSPSKFDDLVQRGLMPRPRLLDSIKVWDRQALDAAFEELPTDGDRQMEWTERAG